jgi:hypothetical protein
MVQLSTLLIDKSDVLANLFKAVGQNYEVI